MLEKQQPIVALDHPQKPKKTRPPRNNLMLSLKKNNLELNLYSSLDPDILNKILSKVFLRKVKHNKKFGFIFYLNFNLNIF